jgi:hypothetical protein
MPIIGGIGNDDDDGGGGGCNTTKVMTVYLSLLSRH